MGKNNTIVPEDGHLGANPAKKEPAGAAPQNVTDSDFSKSPTPFVTETEHAQQTESEKRDNGNGNDSDGPANKDDYMSQRKSIQFALQKSMEDELQGHSSSRDANASEIMSCADKTGLNLILDTELEEWNGHTAVKSRKASFHQVHTFFARESVSTNKLENEMELGMNENATCKTPRTLMWSKFGVRYGPALYILTFVLTILWTVDRWTTMIWPRQWFKGVHGEGLSAGGDNRPLKDGPWTVKAYDAISRSGGRILTVSLNTLIWMMMHTTHRWFGESIFARRRWIDFADSSHLLLHMHKVWGWITGVVLLTHIWSICLPIIFNGYSAIVTPGMFEWPLSERRAEGYKDVKNDEKLIGLESDDVYRLIAMTFVFGFIVPYSFKLIKSNYRLGIEIHRWMFIFYAIDIIRRHTHPHNWVLNTPMVLLWMLDVYVGRSWKTHTTAAQRIILSHDYMVYLWDAPARLGPSCGPEFLVKLANHYWERKHPCTGFVNRGLLRSAPKEIVDPLWVGHSFFVESGVLTRNNTEEGKQLENEESPANWQCGLVVRIYHGQKAHTRKMAEVKNPVLQVSGPFEGSMSADIERRLREKTRLVVVAGGSGAAYLLDCIQNHMLCGECPALFLFTTRDAGLFQWFTWMFEKLQMDETDRSAATRGRKGFTVVGLTARDIAVINNDGTFMKNGQVTLGRLNFMELLAPFKGTECNVFVQGSTGVQEALTEACVEHGCCLHKGASYDNVSKRVVKKTSGGQVKVTVKDKKLSMFHDLGANDNVTSHFVAEGDVTSRVSQSWQVRTSFVTHPLNNVAHINVAPATSSSMNKVRLSSQLAEGATWEELKNARRAQIRMANNSNNNNDEGDSGYMRDAYKAKARRASSLNPLGGEWCWSAAHSKGNLRWVTSSE